MSFSKSSQVSQRIDSSSLLSLPLHFLEKQNPFSVLMPRKLQILMDPQLCCLYLKTGN